MTELDLSYCKLRAVTIGFSGAIQIIVPDKWSRILVSQPEDSEMDPEKWARRELNYVAEVFRRKLND